MNRHEIHNLKVQVRYWRKKHSRARNEVAAVRSALEDIAGSAPGRPIAEAKVKAQQALDSLED